MIRGIFKFIAPLLVNFILVKILAKLEKNPKFGKYANRENSGIIIKILTLLSRFGRKK